MIHFQNNFTASRAFLSLVIANYIITFLCCVFCMLALRDFDDCIVLSINLMCASLFPDQNSVVQLRSSLTLSTTFSERFLQFFCQVFLPQGYPESVSDDYYKYQIWDTVQVSSSLTWYINLFAN